MVSEETWSSCTDGSTVGLYIIHGAAHVWPPYGPGAPLNYPTSEEVWAFLSAHSAAPSHLSSSDVKLLSVRVRVIGRNQAVVSKFHLGEKVTIDEEIGSARNAAARKTFTLDAGAVTVLRLALALRTRAGTYQDVFKIRDSYGRQLTVSRTIRVPEARS